MALSGARWRQFRSFQDTGWIDFRPITILIGANASGKTSLIAPLLLLKQTEESRDPTVALKTKGRLFNAGSYRDLVFRHDAERQVVLDLCFRRDRSDKQQRELELGAYPPGQLSLTYGAAEDLNRAVLAEFVVRDTQDRQMIARHRRADGTYDVKGLAPDEPDPLWQQAIEATPATGFLFDPTNVFSAYYDALRKAYPKGPPDRSLNIPVSEEYSLYFVVSSTTATSTKRALVDTRYLGPLRDRPRRIYELGGEAPFSTGPAGQFAPELLFRGRDTGLSREVNKWIKRFDFGERIECLPLTQGVFSLELHRSSGFTSVNLADTGFGLSQVLPLIVEGFHAPSGSMIIAEQPEIHLNPRLQSILADLFAEISDRKVKVLVETHSEHLLLRLRRLVAEGKLRAADVAVYFTERSGDESLVRQIPLDEAGHIEPDRWPLGFFEDSLSESLALATAQAKHGK